MAKIHRQKTRMEVRIGLDDEHREPAIKALTSALSEVKALKIDQGDSNATYRKKIKESQEKADEAQATLERGKRVMRDVEIIKNFSAHTVKIKDLDSGRFVEERPMTKEDLQMSVGEGEDPTPEADGAVAE